MLKLSKLTDYGTLLMTTLAAAPEAVRNAQELAAETHVSPPTVAKLLKRLVRARLVESTRGAHGGYRLARSPQEITVAEVVRALEGPRANRLLGAQRRLRHRKQLRCPSELARH